MMNDRLKKTYKEKGAKAYPSENMSMRDREEKVMVRQIYFYLQVPNESEL